VSWLLVQTRLTTFVVARLAGLDSSFGLVLLTGQTLLVQVLSHSKMAQLLRDVFSLRYLSKDLIFES